MPAKRAVKKRREKVIAAKVKADAESESESDSDSDDKEREDPRRKIIPDDELVSEYNYTMLDVENLPAAEQQHKKRHQRLLKQAKVEEGKEAPTTFFQCPVCTGHLYSRTEDQHEHHAHGTMHLRAMREELQRQVNEIRTGKHQTDEELFFNWGTESGFSVAEMERIAKGPTPPKNLAQLSTPAVYHRTWEHAEAEATRKLNLVKEMVKKNEGRLIALIDAGTSRHTGIHFMVTILIIEGKPFVLPPWSCLGAEATPFNAALAWQAVEETLAKVDAKAEDIAVLISDCHRVQLNAMEEFFDAPQLEMAHDLREMLAEVDPRMEVEDIFTVCAQFSELRWGNFRKACAVTKGCLAHLVKNVLSSVMKKHDDPFAKHFEMALKFVRSFGHCFHGEAGPRRRREFRLKLEKALEDEPEGPLDKVERILRQRGLPWTKLDQIYSDALATYDPNVKARTITDIDSCRAALAQLKQLRDEGDVHERGTTARAPVLESSTRYEYKWFHCYLYVLHRFEMICVWVKHERDKAQHCNSIDILYDMITARTVEGTRDKRSALRGNINGFLEVTKPLTTFMQEVGDAPCGAQLAHRGWLYIQNCRDSLGRCVKSGTSTAQKTCATKLLEEFNRRVQLQENQPNFWYMMYCMSPVVATAEWASVGAPSYRQVLDRLNCSSETFDKAEWESYYRLIQKDQYSAKSAVEFWNLDEVIGEMPKLAPYIWALLYTPLNVLATDSVVSVEHYLFTERQTTTKPEHWSDRLMLFCNRRFASESPEEVDSDARVQELQQQIAALNERLNDGPEPEAKKQRTEVADQATETEGQDRDE